MAIDVLMWLAYGAVAMFAMLKTAMDGNWTQPVPASWTLLGCMLCLFWLPLVIALWIAMTVRRSRPMSTRS